VYGLVPRLPRTLASPGNDPKDIFLGQALQDGHGVRLELHQRLALARAADLGLPFALLCDHRGLGAVRATAPRHPALRCSRTARGPCPCSHPPGLDLSLGALSFIFSFLPALLLFARLHPASPAGSLPGIPPGDPQSCHAHGQCAKDKQC